MTICTGCGAVGEKALCDTCRETAAFRPTPNSVATRLVDQYREAHPVIAEHWREGLAEVATIKAALTTDARYAARARFNARLAARACCRSHGTTCPACRKADYEAPRWLVRLRDLRDALRAWRHG